MNSRMTDAGYWMPTKPLRTLLSCVLALVVVPLLVAIAIAQTRWTYLERFYVSSYLKSSVASRLALRDRPYEQVLLTRKGQEFFATMHDVELTEDAAGNTSLTLTPDARAAGFQGLTRTAVRVPNVEMYRRLATHIYADRSVLQLAQAPLVAGAVALLALFCWSIPTDLRRARDRRQGARLRGSELVSIAEFNRRIREW